MFAIDTEGDNARVVIAYRPDPEEMSKAAQSVFADALRLEPERAPSLPRNCLPAWTARPTPTLKRRGMSGLSAASQPLKPERSNLNPGQQ